MFFIFSPSCLLSVSFYSFSSFSSLFSSLLLMSLFNLNKTGALLSLFISPISGVMSDYLQLRFGRRKIFILVFPFAISPLSSLRIAPLLLGLFACLSTFNHTHTPLSFLLFADRISHNFNLACIYFCYFSPSFSISLFPIYDLI